jgi:hypothetical protein
MLPACASPAGPAADHPDKVKNSGASMTSMLYLTDAQVVDTDFRPISGLLTGGTMVGGLFHFTRLAGTSLVPGAVFARSIAPA